MLLLLAGAWLFVGREGGADEQTHGIGQTRDERTVEPHAPMPDPFKAALEASKKNRDVNQEPSTIAKGGNAAPAQDPFRQALEASMQKKSATLSSPFGAEK